MTIQLKTIGVYGQTEESFFKALQMAQIDTFIDIRQRRGVRGAKYAFANSRRLQERLADLGIRYLHLKELAPTTEIRKRQNRADKASGKPKRQRQELSDSFAEAYRVNILDSFDLHSLAAELPSDAAVITLFCVERQPAACHRALVAQKIHTILGWPVEHLVPNLPEKIYLK